MRSVAPVLLLVVACSGPPAVDLDEAYRSDESQATFDHTAFDALLKKHVQDGGWVDYAALGADRRALDGYLEQLARAPFDELGRDGKLALLINAYNAFTLRLMLEHPAVAGIRDIPASQRWNAKRWNVAGRVWSLDDIEHREIRPKFEEPRIHFALVCAAVGCPPLRREAYVADRIDEQLEAQTRYVHESATWFSFDRAAKTVALTHLYDWYGDDFVQVAGSVLDYAKRYSKPLADALAAGDKPTVRFLDSDWSHNGVANRKPR